MTRLLGIRQVNNINLCTVPNAPGRYQIIVGLVPEAVKPNVAKAIPGYMDQKTVTVQ